ncbi:DNA polymerase III subunit alpha [Sphingopyxis alaskensis]|jgi:DNA polymerase-3 subunit alpha|uniref:DNA polymerase III subunit alpha n=1 Tax=Sphingopyxis alaskensis (strain DSM 13593 / LMG 18877 / RB2256) TaxID=317655 RepID=Q1GTX7_SPHAL|nr:DNA polymerase III subunit alpha [Sphingopyxis alaskensis]ABF52895.1 DNA polymerase III, alpha subunit [Sphingopyxis alaskensis RB2256]MCM3419602.1 DNA polymerase III subunit alpha [Sphingopyxis alaskensis]
MAFSPFVPLRVFSSYTMLEGAIEPKAIAKAARDRGFPAIAVADRNGLYGVMAFGEACQAAGVQPIVGALLSVARPGQRLANGAPLIDWLALYAQDARGYHNLCALVSAAHLGRPVEQEPHVALSDMTGRTDGLICLTGGGEGALARLLAGEQQSAAEDYMEQLEALFGERLYIELSRRGDATEAAAENALIDMAYARALPLVATNPANFVEPQFHAAHDAMLCIAQSAYVESEDRRVSNPEAWLKPAEAMEDAFSDLPEAIRNTLVIAQRCAFMAPKRKPILPSLAGDREGEAAQLKADAHAGLDARLAHYPDLTDEERQAYVERLDYEIDVITQMGFPGYFLIVADFIKWAKAQDIPVGPGRGSGAGSVVAWALTITDLDPLKLGLLFERFLNPERVSMPDFDIDFCETRRGEVIRYVQEKYGRDTVAQIITFGKLKARAVLKDTGRVLQMSYGQVDRLAKLVPNHPTDPWTLERALNGVSELMTEYKQDDGVRRLFDMARQLEGLPRHSSTHAAGVVIGDRPLDQLVPLYRDPRSDMPVTQFDMKYVETAGLVKFDFLGLKTLSVLKEARRLLALRGIDVDLDTLRWDDAQVYELLQRGDTVGVFQLESEGMRRTLSAVKPTSFGDIIALVALYRPGPMDNIPLFGARKNGREPIAYPHPLLEGILAETYGIFVYQEQVMQAAQILAGYSLGGADLLRRAMGKKIQAEMDAQRETFVKGCGEHNQIDAKTANELFDLIDKFAGYGFNKSHAAAYALLSYQTAWLKAHHPHEFFAASMSFDSHQTDKLSVFIDDMRRLGIDIAPPSINESEADFSVGRTDDGLAVRYALGALKGVGEKAMEALVAERQARGDFASLDDFASRIDPKLLNRRQIEALAGAGAFDCVEPDRPRAFAGAEALLACANSSAHERSTGQGGLFGGDIAIAPTLQLPAAEPWTLAERMTREKEAFGFYFSAHPVEQYEAILSARGARSYGDICENVEMTPGTRIPMVMAAMVESARARVSQRGNRFLNLTLSDRSGQFQSSCFDEAAGRVLEALADEGGCALLSVELDLLEGEETPRVTVRGAQSLADIAATASLQLLCRVEAPEAIDEMARLLEKRGGARGRVIVVTRNPLTHDDVRIELGRGFVLGPDIVARLDLVAGISEAALSLVAPREFRVR